MITLPSTDATLRHGLDRVFPRAGLLDYEAAHQFADWLQEQGDWRWHLLANVAFCSGAGHTEYAYLLTRGGRPPHPYRPGEPTRCEVLAAVPAGPLAPLVIRVEFGESRCRFAHLADGVALNLVTPDTSIWSWLTPEQYGAMRADAALAGVAFPARPL